MIRALKYQIVSIVVGFLLGCAHENSVKKPWVEEGPREAVKDWKAPGTGTIYQRAGILVIESTGEDPYLQTGAIPPCEEPLIVHLRIKSSSSGKAAFYWTTDKQPRMGPPLIHNFDVVHDGQWHEYRLILPVDGRLRILRLDPSRAPGTIEVDWLRIAHKGGTLLKRWEFYPEREDSVPVTQAREPEPALRRVNVFDFIERSREARILHAVSTQFEMVESGGQGRNAIFQHANASGQPLAEVTYPHVVIPSLADGIEKAHLEFFIGFRDGEAFQKAPAVDGCRFIVRVDGAELFSREYKQQQWEPHQVDLAAFAGREVAVSFLIHPRGNTAADWSSWATPRIMAQGIGPGMEKLAEAHGRTIPKIWPVKELLKRIPSDRMVLQHEDDKSVVSVGVLDDTLDLSSQLMRTAPAAGRPPVPLAPSLVVGEGADPENHTLIKILGPYGIADLQFLAYPPEVRGGVQVATLHRSAGPPYIVAAPISDSDPREIRLFNRGGGWVGGFEVADVCAPPFSMVTGDFHLDQPGDEIAVTSARYSAGRNAVLLYDSHGNELTEWTISHGLTGQVQLAGQMLEGRMRPMLYFPDAKKLLHLHDHNRVKEADLSFLPEGARIYESAFSRDRLLASVPDNKRSKIIEFDDQGVVTERDVGRRENRFWIALAPEFEEELGALQGKQEADHIRICEYGHLRMESVAWPILGPKSASPQPAAAAAQATRALFEKRGFFQPLDAQSEKMWNPCFTHRMPRRVFKDWAMVEDEATGRPKYLMTGSTGAVDGYGQWESDGFVSSSYAPGVNALNRLYLLPLRSFLRSWAPHYRQEPERVPSVEPNHEHEIIVASDNSMGDYNPAMISGFFEYLVDRYGRDAAGINRALGTSFSDFFDAPRNRDRGSWDAYDAGNPFFAEWIRFNRRTVNQVLAMTFREALLAGLPPELIKSHQIPDTYALPRISRFGAPQRLTPIDYAMTAGVGYGFTRFGSFYQRKDNVQYGAHSSGFDTIVLGELQALTDNEEQAYQHLKWVFENGATAVHILFWSDAHGSKEGERDMMYNRTMHAAVQRLIRENPPRPGVTGGVGQVRPFRDGDQVFDLAVIGTGPEHTGLIKSLKKDGSMEGTVYVVPFHAHVDVSPIPYASTVSDTRRVITLGPLGQMEAGTQIEWTFKVRSAEPAKLRIDVLRDTSVLPGLTQEWHVESEWKTFRYVLRVNLPVDALVLKLSAVPGLEWDEVRATLQSEQVAFVHRGIMQGQRHRGAVTFDVLE